IMPSTREKLVSLFLPASMLPTMMSKFIDSRHFPISDRFSQPPKLKRIDKVAKRRKTSWATELEISDENLNKLEKFVLANTRAKERID
ncbi:MAG: hypothetical protein ACE5K3_02100, partial [bacterium]